MATAAKTIVVLIFLIFGISLGSLFFLNEINGIYSVGVIIPVFLVSFYLIRSAGIIYLGLALIVLGFFYAVLFGEWHRDLDVAFLMLPARAHVVSDPIIKNDLQYFYAKSAFGLGNANKVVAPPNPAVQYGNEILIEGNVHGFFPKTVIFAKQLSIINYNNGHFRGIIITFRKNFVAAIRDSLPTKEGGLLAGIAVGDRSMTPNKFEEAMRNSGVSHMTALSGYNVSVLVFAVGVILQPLLRRKVLLVATIGLLFTFILSTGGEASIVRAGLMGFLALWASFFGRQYSFWHSTLFVVLLMLLFDPFAIWIDPGFSLSFLALFGISYFTKPIQSRFSRFRLFTKYPKFIEILSVSIAAQICVLPILVFWFEKFQIFGLIPNIILAPIIPLLMALGFILGIIGIISSVIGSFFALAILPLLGFVVRLIEFFAEFPVVVIDGFGWALGIIYLVVLGVLLYRVRFEKTFIYDEG